MGKLMPGDDLRDSLADELRALRSELQEARERKDHRLDELETELALLKSKIRGLEVEQEFQERLKAEFDKRSQGLARYHVPITVAAVLAFGSLVLWILRQAWLQIAQNLTGGG